MKNKLCMLFAIVLLLVGGCNEKSQNYFAGTILNEYYGAAEPPVRCGESHLSGLTEPLRSL